MYRCCEYIVRLWRLWPWHENHKADLRDSLLRLTTPEQFAEGRFTTGHAELHLVRAMAHHAMGNDQEAPPGEREASLHVIFKCLYSFIFIYFLHTHTHTHIYIYTYNIFNMVLGNQDQMIVVNLLVGQCITLIRMTRSNLICGPMEAHIGNLSHAKARPFIRSMT